MDEISWLISLACSHTKHKEPTIVKSLAEPESGISEVDTSVVSELTDKCAIDKAFMDCTDIPERFRELSRIAILTLAYFIRAKMTGNQSIAGHEIIKLPLIKEDYTPYYLQALDELEKAQWLSFTPNDNNIAGIRPYQWLQSRAEMGGQFSNTQLKKPESYSSNEEYLDEILKYIDRMSRKLVDSKQTICSEDIHYLPEWKADEQYLRIEQKLANTTIPIPAAAIKNEYGLSGWQYLFLLGIIGKTEQVVEYDFSDLNDVVKLFASSFSVRQLMREHLVSKNSQLIKHKLFENIEDWFCTSIKPTAKAMRSITGKLPPGKSIADIKKYVGKETLFELETPKIKAGAVMLPQEVMEVIETILHTEKSGGRKIRSELKKNIPTQNGTPTGTTVLLYGPSGTGKTLTASYIASELKVPLLRVDCTKILGMYVSESERNVKKMFDDYSATVKLLHKKPVLLLNEADQLLGKRIEARSSAAQSNNNVQNLFLEALERFDGILVATTNMRELLDMAYSRRFTYKLELPEPNMALRKRLWQTYIPEKFYDDSINLDQLAALNLTGGEIRLVLEQAVRSLAYRGEKRLKGTQLYEIAQKEVIASGKHAPQLKIGFSL